MIVKRLAPLEQYSANHFKDWLIIGVRKMCGADENVADAFSPIADLVGVSRETSWIKELVVVNTMLSSSAGLKFSDGLNKAMSEVSDSLSNQNWEVAIMLVDLMREIDVHPRMEGLKALTNRLTSSTSELSIAAKKKLALNTLMAAFETCPSERSDAQFVAQQLTDLIYRLFADRRQEVSNRLKLGLAKLGMQSQEDNDSLFNKACEVWNAFSRGSKHATA